VNVAEGLQRIKEQLEDNGASPATIQLVNGILLRAKTPSGQQATAKSMIELARMLQRTPAATNDIKVYNDLLKLEEGLQANAAAHRDRMASEERQAEAHAQNRSKKYYKEQKEKDKR